MREFLEHMKILKNNLPLLKNSQVLNFWNSQHYNLDFHLCDSFELPINLGKEIICSAIWTI